MARLDRAKVRAAWALAAPGRYVNPLIAAVVVEEGPRCWCWSVSGVSGLRARRTPESAMGACERAASNSAVPLPEAC